MKMSLKEYILIAGLAGSGTVFMMTSAHAQNCPTGSTHYGAMCMAASRCPSGDAMLPAASGTSICCPAGATMELPSSCVVRIPGIIPTCPQGFTLQGGQCITPPTTAAVLCPLGQHPSGAACVCADGKAPQNGRCPTLTPPSSSGIHQ